VLIPLWLPWTIFLAAALFAVLDQDALPRYGRDPGRWAVALIALVVAGSLTVDRHHVSDSELYDTVERVVDTLDGTADQLPPDRLAALVEDRLGHEVEVSLVEDDDDDDLTTSLEVRVGDDPVVCVGISYTQPNALVPSMANDLPTLRWDNLSSQPCDQ
jgi:hypothetical protein